ncbi:uncharacterized protein EDB91DRAFT_1159446 [Suillus paluster]|uniref:uncharacterized protein n=1 Tax=Suillus paluster TaxID=48578 RepID=UPI001B87D445|nr:uncharacterized protein EDB91DRAFT_1159446 [Suillus paluster]KAG1729519.1 hypothetical protein EDB91DRAFT_1159446 [Suillus paluster]
MHSYSVLVANSILIYDHIVTLPEEITFIWCRPKARSAVLFFINRYVALLGNICGLVMDFLPVSDKSCSHYVLARQLLIYFQQFIVCLILTLRVYALYGGNKRLVKWIVTIGLGLAGAASAGTFGHFSSNETILLGIGCYETYTAKTAARLGLAWLALFVFELLIFALTVYRIFRIRGLLRLSLVTRRNIVDIIFHDGAMYFGAMVLCNIPNILTYYSGSVATRGSLATFTSCMSVTLISRLMLNLHKSINAGIFSTPAQDGDHGLIVLTTRVDVQSAISSHHW